MIEQPNDDLKHYITQQVIPDLQDAGFDSSLESDQEDYFTLTIQRKHHYY